MLDPALDHDEGAEQPAGQDERAEGAGRGPADLGCRDDGVDEQQHRAGGEGRAEQVVTALLGRLAARQQHERRGQRGQRDRHRQQEGPAPADAGHQATEEQAGGVAAGAEDGVDRQRLVARRSLGEVRGDEGEPGRRGERRRQPLHEAGQDEERSAAHQTAGEGGEGEDGEGDEEDPPASEQVGGAAAEQQQAAVPEHVAADQPLQRGRRQVELRADRGEGDADHRDVEAVEEQHDAQGDQHRPDPGTPRRGARDGRAGRRESGWTE